MMARRLTRTDWADAALTAIATRGVDAVNIESLAHELDATKGSFYHHFKSRRELVEAALLRFEETIRASVATLVADHPDPRVRVRHGIEEGLAGEQWDDGWVDIALVDAVDDPMVAAIARRLAELRIRYLEDAVIEAGISPSVARRRVRDAVTHYLGIYCYQRLLDIRLPDDELLMWLREKFDAMFEPDETG